MSGGRMRRLGDLDREAAAARGPNPEMFQQSGASSGTAIMRPPDGGSEATAPIDASQIINMARQQRQGMGPVTNQVARITMYRNGFQVGDGEFRDLRDPRNAKFLQALKRGEVPEELESIAHEQFGGNVQSVGVNVVDKSGEDFIPPKSAFHAFQGTGFALGGSVDSSSPTSSSFAAAVARQAVANASQPTIVLRITTHDRRRTEVTLNETHTVLDLYQHVMAISGQSSPFSLLSGYPPKPLTNPKSLLRDVVSPKDSIVQKMAP